MSFGDYEAEDAWDASDDFSTHVDNLIERLAQLDMIGFVHAPRTRADLDVIDARLDVWRRRRDELDDHTRERVRELIEDLDALRAQSP